MKNTRNLLPFFASAILVLNSCQHEKIKLDDWGYLPLPRMETVPFSFQVPEEFESSCAFATSSVDLLPALAVAQRDCVVMALPNFPSTVFIDGKTRNLHITICYFDETGVHCEVLHQGDYSEGVNSLYNSSAKIFAISYSAEGDYLETLALEAVFPQLINDLIEPYYESKESLSSTSAKEA